MSRFSKVWVTQFCPNTGGVAPDLAGAKHEITHPLSVMICDKFLSAHTFVIN